MGAGGFGFVVAVGGAAGAATDLGAVTARVVTTGAGAVERVGAAALALPVLSVAETGAVASLALGLAMLVAGVDGADSVERAGFAVCVGRDLERAKATAAANSSAPASESASSARFRGGAGGVPKMPKVLLSSPNEAALTRTSESARRCD